MLQTKIVIKHRYRLTDGDRENIRNHIKSILQHKEITDLYIEEHSCL